MDSQIPSTEPTQPESPAPRRTNLFVGPNGLRAGWKAVIFLVGTELLILLLVPFVFLFVPPFEPHKQPRLNTMMAIEVLETVVALLMTGAMAKLIDRQKWGYFGLPLNKALGKNFWIGAVTGFCALAIQLELMHLGGWFDFGPMVLHGGDVLKYGALWGFLFLCTGIFEESFLRGYPQRVLTDGMKFWPAALVLSLLFSLVHITNSGENAFGLVMIVIDGLLMCWCLWRTGNMWFGVGNHAAWDWAQTFFFGTPDSGLKPLHALFSPTFHGPTLLSGGTAGPEGSVLVVISEALIAIFVFFVYPKRQYPLKEDAASSATDPMLSQNLTVISEGYPPPPLNP